MRTCDYYLRAVGEEVSAAIDLLYASPGQARRAHGNGEIRQRADRCSLLMDVAEVDAQSISPAGHRVWPILPAPTAHIAADLHRQQFRENRNEAGPALHALTINAVEGRPCRASTRRAGSGRGGSMTIGKRVGDSSLQAADRPYVVVGVQDRAVVGHARDAERWRSSPTRRAWKKDLGGAMCHCYCQRRP